jgi:hypothetical protein
MAFVEEKYEEKPVSTSVANSSGMTIRMIFRRIFMVLL